MSLCIHASHFSCRCSPSRLHLVLSLMSYWDWVTGFPQGASMNHAGNPSSGLWRHVLSPTCHSTLFFSSFHCSFMGGIYSLSPFLFILQLLGIHFGMAFSYIWTTDSWTFFVRDGSINALLLTLLIFSGLSRRSWII